MYAVISTIITLAIGALAGWIAGKLMKSPGGMIRNIIMGCLGGFLGGIICGLFGLNTFGIIGSIILSIVGASILIWITDKLFSKKE